MSAPEITYEPDGVTPLHHVAWTTVGGPGPAIRPSDIPADGECMEWQIPGQGLWDSL